MRRATVAAALAAAACANSKLADARPDWNGPPLAVTNRADGGLQLELLAPTAGHTFELRDVVRDGAGTADVQLLHRTPGDAFVAQVVTPLPLGVPAERLAGCHRVRLWIDTRQGTDDERAAPARLAFVLLRPPQP